MLECNECSSSYQSKRGLNKHKRKKHVSQKIKSEFDMNNMFCYMCNKSFCYTGKLRSHLTEEHNISLEVEKLLFHSFLDFETWRKEMEHKSNVRYVQANGTKRSTDKDTIYLRCHRTGVFKEKKGSKNMKSQGTCKINNHCTSSMIVEVFKSAIVRVKFFKDHFGHELELQHLPLSKLDKDLVVGKLKQGVSANTVLEQVRDSMKGSCERIHFITRKQILRIEQCINKCTKG